MSLERTQTGRTRPRRALGALLLALASAACASRTPRLYEGPERPLEEVALIRVVGFEAEGLVLKPDPIGRALIAVDGRRIPYLQVEVLPGRHTLCARCWHEEGFFDVQRNLSFVAEAGGRYLVAPKSRGQGVSLVVMDDATGKILDDSFLRPESTSPLALTFGGERWERAFTSVECETRWFTWLPAGQGEENWTETVSILEITPLEGEAPALEAILKERDTLLDEMRVLEKGPGQAVFTYTGEDPRNSVRPYAGLGVVRVVGERAYVCFYECTGEALPPAARDTWRSRFLSASVLTPPPLP